MPRYSAGLAFFDVPAEAACAFPHLVSGRDRARAFEADEERARRDEMHRPRAEELRIDEACVFE